MGKKKLACVSVGILGVVFTGFSMAFSGCGKAPLIAPTGAGTAPVAVYSVSGPILFGAPGTTGSVPLQQQNLTLPLTVSMQGSPIISGIDSVCAAKYTSVNAAVTAAAVSMPNSGNYKATFAASDIKMTDTDPCLASAVFSGFTSVTALGMTTAVPTQSTSASGANVDNCGAYAQGMAAVVCANSSATDCMATNTPTIQAKCETGPSILGSGIADATLVQSLNQQITSNSLNIDVSQAIYFSTSTDNLVQDPGFQSGTSGFYAQYPGDSATQSSVNPITGPDSLLMNLNRWGGNVWWSLVVFNTSNQYATGILVSGILRANQSSTNSPIWLCADTIYKGAPDMLEQCTSVNLTPGQSTTASAALPLDPTQALDTVNIRVTLNGPQAVSYSLDGASVLLALPTP